MTTRSDSVGAHVRRNVIRGAIGAVLLVSAGGVSVMNRDIGTDPASMSAGVSRIVRSMMATRASFIPAPSPRLHPSIHPAADPGFGELWTRSHDLIIPVLNARPSDLIDTFTQLRSAGRRHEAIDIRAPRGTPVVAVTDGIIVRLAVHDSGGITLYLAAPDNETVFYYAHLDRYADSVHEGMHVRQGDVIGHVGDTGNPGPGNYHLHFEVQAAADARHAWTGKPRNPYPLLLRARG